MIVSYRFSEYLLYSCFLGKGYHLLTFLLSYYVWGTSKFQNNFRSHIQGTVGSLEDQQWIP